MKIERRSFLAGATALALPRIARGAEPSVLKVVPEGDLAIVDPVFTTATVVRNHGYMVFDTLYGTDDANVAQPQMVAGHVVENDGKQWTLTLREGLVFHDGQKVLGRDAVASIRRWAARDSFGGALMDATDELSSPDDRTIRFRLKRPFALLPDALGKPGTPMPCIMPERLAKTDPNKQVTEMVGSGPFRFLADERVAGSRVAYEKFAGYVPRKDGAVSGTAGPKIVYFDRVEWHVIPDSSTAVNALTNGEVDWVQDPAVDLLPLLRGNKKIKVENLDPAGGIGILRFNTLFPPFDNAAIRRALFGAVDQSEFMTAAWGTDRSLWKDGVGVFSPGTPMDSRAGIEVLTGKRDYDKVKRELLAAGYKGEKVVLLGASDYPEINALALVAADMLKRVGMNVDLQAEDWGTTVQRRGSRKPPEQGGWNVYFTYLNGTNNYNPAGQLGIRGNGAHAWFGWPTMPKIEALRAAWFEAPDLAAQKKICEEIQMQFWQDAPYLPLGSRYGPTAYNASLTGVRSSFIQFYNVRRT
jgi:peptide/nickel transport system substrate-binding protein